MSKFDIVFNDNNNYTLKFNYCFIECTNFKEKELNVLRNIISKARLGKELVFYRYANISFNENDSKHEYPVITEFENFARGKTNAIIFKMDNEMSSQEKYNRCIIYQTVSKNDGFYGYLFYNTETGEYNHTYNLTYELTNLFSHLYQSIDFINREKLYDDYLTKTTGGVRKFKRYQCFPNTPPADQMDKSVDEINWLDEKQEKNIYF